MRLSSCRATTHLLQALLLCFTHVCTGATNPTSAHGEETFLTKEDFDNAKHADIVLDGVVLSTADFANGLKLRDDELYTAKQFKLYAQNNFRGDIRGTAAWSLDTKGVHRNGVMHQRKIWVNGRIPYVISNQYNHRERALLARAIEEYHRRTCIRFEPRSAFDNDYLYIGKIDGAGGRQELSLDDGCLEYDTAIHELMHAVGFYHEHERWDRDEFINILWQNIDRGLSRAQSLTEVVSEAYDQFGRVDLTDSSYYGQPYDYYSIMHYDSLAFSKNGFETLVARRPEMTQIIGNAMDFSQIDLAKINSMYGCPQGVRSVGTFGAQNWGPVPNWPAATQPPPPPTPLPPSAIVPSTTQSGAECRDRTNLCWRWIDRCRSYFFEKIMREFCSQSCGFCTESLTVQRPTQFGTYQQYGKRR